MYAAQGMRNKWYSVLGDDFMDESDDDQDSLKVLATKTSLIFSLLIYLSVLCEVVILKTPTQAA